MFQNDLADGKRGEQLLALALMDRGHTVTDVSDVPQYQRKDIDFVLTKDSQTTTIEVKNDMKSETTGNIFVETFAASNISRNYDGWYYYCEADYLAFVQETKRVAHIVSRADLITFVESKKFRQIGGNGGESAGYIIPLLAVQNCGTYCRIDL